MFWARFDGLWLVVILGSRWQVEGPRLKSGQRSGAAAPHVSALEALPRLTPFIVRQGGADFDWIRFVSDSLDKSLAISIYILFNGAKPLKKT